MNEVVELVRTRERSAEWAEELGANICRLIVDACFEQMQDVPADEESRVEAAREIIANFERICGSLPAAVYSHIIAMNGDPQFVLARRSVDEIRRISNERIDSLEMCVGISARKNAY